MVSNWYLGTLGLYQGWGENWAIRGQASEFYSVIGVLAEGGEKGWVLLSARAGVGGGVVAESTLGAVFLHT